MSSSDGNLFMMCESLATAALRRLPPSYHLRRCRRGEVDTWMKMPFDDPLEAERHRPLMKAYFDRVYAPRTKEFFERCAFVCDSEDTPIGTGFVWRIYGELNTLHWFKVVPEHEGQGVGRGLLSIILGSLEPADFPVYLHTHPVNLRAIKLYSDFGFQLLTDPVIGSRPNHLSHALPYLRSHMPDSAFRSLRFAAAPKHFLSCLEREIEPEF